MCVCVSERERERRRERENRERDEYMSLWDSHKQTQFKRELFIYNEILMSNV